MAFHLYLKVPGKPFFSIFFVLECTGAFGRLGRCWAHLFFVRNIFFPRTMKFRRVKRKEQRCYCWIIFTPIVTFRTWGFFPFWRSCVETLMLNQSVLTDRHSKCCVLPNGSSFSVLEYLFCAESVHASTLE